jgi:hypothetical protein
MSRPKEPLPAKLVMGFLFGDLDLQYHVLRTMIDRFGPLDFLTRPERFTYTTYYDREMGSGLSRQTCSFLELVDVESLPEIKLFTNELENQLSESDNRQVNIDPGLLSEERFILATGKNFTHRIYLRKGIYADLTLIYQKGYFRTLPWTYPDHQNPELLHFLVALRQKLIYQRDGKFPRNPVQMRPLPKSLLFDVSGKPENPED